MPGRRGSRMLASGDPQSCINPAPSSFSRRNAPELGEEARCRRCPDRAREGLPRVRTCLHAWQPLHTAQASHLRRDDLIDRLNPSTTFTKEIPRNE
jgi:hypothetical protein